MIKFDKKEERYETKKHQGECCTEHAPETVVLEAADTPETVSVTFASGSDPGIHF